MNKSRRIALSAAIFVCYASLAEDAASRARFDGDAIVRVYVSDDAQLASLLDMTDDVWSHGVGLGPVDVRLSVASQVAIELLGWDYDVLIPDLQSLIDDRGGQSDATAGVSSVFDNFQPLSVVDAHLLALENLRPDLAERVQIGTSLRGRPMYVVRISGPGDTADRPDIFIHGGIHAREWITVTTVLYLADRLVHDYDSDSYVRRLVNQANWYIMPVYNPDGYDYSWTNNRLWRKNRRSSFGVDLNRNYDANWGGVGSSGSPNDQTYRGAAPFSEPETQAVRDFVLGLPNFAGYFDVHSYSQLLMWPWGPTPALPEDNLEFEILGQEMVRLIQDVHGRTYAPGPIYTTIYPVSGGSIDWVYQDTGVLAMTFELRDTGEAGFLLPPNQILPNAEEAFPALLHYADHVSAPIR
ncbi:MAG: M14 family metallopeptidase, partial [Phycisphaerae bacterium]